MTTYMKIGYRPDWPFLYRIYNAFMASVIILIILPLLVLISLSLFITQGRDILYRGPRLGAGGRVFHVLKFRTLCAKRASIITRDRPLPRDSGVETPLGGFLRESRLDELPQLFNIVLGDMNICGPRPVRPEIAAIEVQRIPQYDLRFAVKPGLIGPTQACFGHGASKRLRARMNNRLVRRRVSLAAEIVFLGRIALCIPFKVLGELRRGVNRPFLTAARRPRADIWLVTANGDRVTQVEEIGMRRVTVDDLALGASSELGVIYVRLQSGSLRKARVLLSETEKLGVFNYTAVSEYGEFVIERYALGLVVLPPKLKTAPPDEKLTASWGEAYA